MHTTIYTHFYIGTFLFKYTYSGPNTVLWPKSHLQGPCVTIQTGVDADALSNKHSN